MSYSLDPDQDRRSVGPDLDPNGLQRLSADDKITLKSQSFSGKESRMGDEITIL